MIGELFQEGRTTKTAIAEATGFNHKTVSKYLKDNQLPKRKVNKQKEENKVLLIVQFYQKKYKQWDMKVN